MGWLFVMHELSKKTTCVETMLSNLPSGLPALYSRMLLQVESSRRPIISKIIRWVTIAIRPLKLQELVAAISIQSTESLSSNQIMLDYILLSGHNLKIHEQHVNLVHESARDYLLQEKFDSDPILEQFRTKAEKSTFRTSRDMS